MTAFLAGLAILRCQEHERAAEFDSTARWVLAVMGSFAAETAAGVPPECYAAHSSIARRAGLHRNNVATAIGRLEKLGAIQRAGTRGKTIRWRLMLLVQRSSAQADPRTLVHRSSAQGADTQPALEQCTSNAPEQCTSNAPEQCTMLPTTTEVLPKKKRALDLIRAHTDATDAEAAAVVERVRARPGVRSPIAVIRHIAGEDPAELVELVEEVRLFAAVNQHYRDGWHCRCGATNRPGRDDCGQCGEPRPA